MNRIRRVGPMLEAAQPRDYKRIDAEEYFRMQKRREDIPWRVAGRIFEATISIARESGTNIAKAVCVGDKGTITDCTKVDIQKPNPQMGSDDIKALEVIFTRRGGPGDFFVWGAECTIMLYDDDYWSIFIEQSLNVKEGGQWIDMIEGISIFLCDDVRGLEAALRDTVSASSAKSGQVMSGMVELLGMFG